jgi:hypothetical protein
MCWVGASLTGGRGRGPPSQIENPGQDCPSIS